MTERIRKACYMTDLLTWFLLYYGILCIGLYTYNNNITPCLVALLTVLPFAGTVLLSQYAKNAALYVLYHAALLAAIWLCHFLLPAFLDMGNALLLTAAVIVPFLLFFTKRLHAEKDAHYLNITPLLAMVFFILWIIADQMDFAPLATLIIAAACGFLMLCLLGQYLNNFYDYMENNSQVANMPIGAILHSSNGVMAIFMVLAMACILLFTNLGLGRLITALKELLLSGIRYLLSLAPESEPTQYSANVAAETGAAAQPQFMAEDGGTSPIMIAISNVIFTILQIALIIGAAVLIIYTIYQLYRRFGSFNFNKKAKIAAQDDCNDVVEKIVTPKRARRSFLFTGTMPEDKIRRLYYKKIRSAHKKEPVPQTQTPSELTQSLQPSDLEAAARFTALYEKARYSNHAPTAEDIASAKSLAKKL